VSQPSEPRISLPAQIDWGVRVDELHQVSPSAAYIHPGIAKRLQDLWDEGSNLLSLLDDRCCSMQMLQT
jgi:hypothetical protein